MGKCIKNTKYKIILGGNMNSNTTMEQVAEELQKLKKEIILLKEEKLEKLEKQENQRILKEMEYYKSTIKNELKDELKKDLAGRDDILLVKYELKNEMSSLRKEVEMIRAELKNETKDVAKEIRLIRRDMIIIALILLLAIYVPTILGKMGI
jgi:hypothetical protein